jgi:hypothetical protein
MPDLLAAPYDSAFKKRVIQKYVEENNSAPSKAQLFELMRDIRREYPGAAQVGFSGQDIIPPLFRKTSSSDEENKNREAIQDDMQVLGGRIESLGEFLEESYRVFIASASRSDKLLRQLDKRLNNLLLLAGRSDVFVYGIEEGFDTQESIDFEKSTVTVEPGYCTMNRERYTKVDLEKVNLGFTTIAPKGLLSTRVINSIDSLKEADGNIWEYHVKTPYSMGRVSAAIDIAFEEREGVDISDLRLTGSPIDANGKTTWTVFYSLDGSSFHAIEPVEREFYKGENQASIGRSGVRKIRIVLTKSAADDISASGKENFYIYTLDSLELFVDQYKTEARSVLYAGPYDIYDDQGDPYDFSMAAMGSDTCCVLPDRTSVSFFLSKDGISYEPVSWTGKSLNVVQFHDTNPDGTFTFLDATENQDALVLPDDEELEYDFGKEAYLNLFVDDVTYPVVRQSVRVKRNLSQSGKNLYGTAAGWAFDPNTSQFSTTVQVSKIEGRWLDLGTTSAFVNDRLVSGRIRLPQGTHTFRTADSNWYNVEANITTLEDLEAQDAVYPYNHKLLIEGYDYSLGFQGEQIYQGVDEFYGALLRFSTPEKFEDEDNDANLSIFTLVEYNGNLYFKVKVDPTDGSWRDELISVEYMTHRETGSQLYVKAIVSSLDSRISPHINHFQVRVI